MTEEVDVQQNLPAIPQSQSPVHRTAMEIPVAEFEGEYVRLMLGRLPQLTMEMEVGYPRGTHLKLELEVRIKDLSVTEDRRGDLTRVHQFVLEEVKLLGAYAADELDPGVGGSAGVTQEDVDELDDRPELESEEEKKDDVGF